MDGTGRTFRSTSPGGLDRGAFPMRLWEKSKRLGGWDPALLDLSEDARQWRGLGEEERDVLLRLTALFQAGEEAVAVDLLPLVGAVVRTGRLEEEIYLAAFLFEEAKHVDAFRRFFDEVAGETGDLSRYHGPGYRRLFHEELPGALRRLEEDDGPAALARASTTYHLVVEGVLAETGYHAYADMLEERELLPGTREIVRHVQRDESRHLAYGVYLLSRLVAEGGDGVWETIEDRMDELLPVATGVIEETFDAYETMPFGLQREDFLDYALERFRRRIERVEAARGKSPEEVEEAFRR